MLSGDSWVGGRSGQNRVLRAAEGARYRAAGDQALKGPHKTPSTEDKRKLRQATAEVCFHEETVLHTLPQAHKGRVHRTQASPVKCKPPCPELAAPEVLLEPEDPRKRPR